MPEDFISKVLCDCAIEGVNYVSKQTSHLLHVPKNLVQLKSTYEELNCRKEDVESKILLELRSGKRVKSEVQLWCNTVQRIGEEKEYIENNVACRGFFECLHLGGRLVEIIQEIKEHYQKGNFTGSLVIDESPDKGLKHSTKELAGETTLRRIWEKILGLIVYDVDRKIGLFGMIGSGKTTIMEHTYNEILEFHHELFDCVIWVSVSKNSTLEKLQEDIASALSVDISMYEDEKKGAEKLFAIMRGRGRYLLFLVGMEKDFILEDVGIPEPTLENGCKIVLTTQSLDVCRRMDCKATIKMELLSEEEAREFFFDTVGRDILQTPGLKEIVGHVATKCGCLHLAIDMIARSMRGVVDVREWRNALEELTDPARVFKVMQEVLQKLQYSYSCLENETLQHCLRRCALHLRNKELEEGQLIDLLIDDGIVEGTNRQAKLNNGHTLLSKLERACLLKFVTNGYGQHVKMHNLIVDMALQINDH